MPNKKKSIAPLIIILVAVIVCVLLIVGTIVGVSFLKKQKEEAEQTRIEKEMEKEEREKRREERESARAEEAAEEAAEGTDEEAAGEDPLAAINGEAAQDAALPTPTPLEIPQSQDAAVPQSVDGIIYQADVYESLTLRTQPSTSAEAICLLPAYTEMYIIERTNDTMVKIITVENNLTGYVNKNYITPKGAIMERAGKSQPQSYSSSSVYYANVDEFLTLRNAPSTSAEAIDYLPPYTAMYVLEWSGKMAKVIVVETGQTGYVNGDYIITY